MSRIISRALFLIVWGLFLLAIAGCGDRDGEGPGQSEIPAPKLGSIHFGDSSRVVFEKIQESGVLFAYPTGGDYSGWDKKAETRLFDRRFEVAFSFNDQDRLYKIRLSTPLGRDASEIDPDALTNFLDLAAASYSKKYGDPYHTYSRLDLPLYEGGSFYTARWRVLDNQYSIEQFIYNKGSLEFVISIVDDVQYLGTVVREPRKTRGSGAEDPKEEPLEMDSTQDLI